MLNRHTLNRNFTVFYESEKDDKVTIQRIYVTVNVNKLEIIQNYR